MWFNYLCRKNFWAIFQRVYDRSDYHQQLEHEARLLHNYTPLKYLISKMIRFKMNEWCSVIYILARAPMDMHTYIIYVYTCIYRERNRRITEEEIRCRVTHRYFVIFFWLLSIRCSPPQKSYSYYSFSLSLSRIYSFLSLKYQMRINIFIHIGIHCLLHLKIFFRFKFYSK